MSKNIIITALLITFLGTAYLAYDQSVRLKELTARLDESPATGGSGSATEGATGGATSKSTPQDRNPGSQGKGPERGSDQGEESPKRMMRGFSKLMDNPAMNEMIKVQQKATIEALYKEFAEGLELSDEESTHFMELLLNRQMKRVELGLALMGGVDPEKKEALMQGVKTNDEYIKGEIEYFLNNEDDLESFNYYEKTTNERTAVGGLATRLKEGGTPLEEGLEADLTRIMHDERNEAEFSVKFSEDDDDLQKFTSANIDIYSGELKEVNGKIMERASTLLDEEQLKAFSTTLDENVAMIRAQLEMTGSMFGTLEGGQK